MSKRTIRLWIRAIAFGAGFFMASGKVVLAQEDLESFVASADPTTKEFVAATFKGFKLMNAQTNETAKKNNLHFDIAHRFGEVFVGERINLHGFFGLDQAPDIRFSFDYGITDRLQVGVGRSKGLEPYKELYDGNVKYRLLRQTTDHSMPISVTLYGVAAVSGRKSSADSTSDAYFKDHFAHRMSYVTQVILARKFSPGISVLLIPTWSHRNYVYYEDENDFFSLGLGGRFKVSRRTALVFDYFHNFSTYRNTAKNADGTKLFYHPLSLGMEFETGGHVFSLMFTNASGILENSFFPYTKSNWADGAFRWGFNLTRNFVLGKSAW